MGIAISNKSFLYENLTESELKQISIEHYKKKYKDIYLLLLHSINQNKLFLEYQPQININTGLITGIEALVRLKDSQGNLISPNTFIHIAEKTNLIHDLTFNVIELGFSQMAEWDKNGYNYHKISFNISTETLFENKDFISFLKNMINKYNINTKNVKFEITETVLVEDSICSPDKLNKIIDLGIEFSIDDFGSGYSSLAYLRHLPVSEVKIDREFVKNIDSSEKDKKILKLLITLIKEFGFSLIIEGVENKEQEEILKMFSCSNIQGFYYYKPMNKKMLEKVFRAEGFK